MKYPLEEKLPYMWLALAVLAIFYGIYFSKMLVQKRHGIRTHQIGRRKEKTLHTIEMLMGIATLGAPAAQLLSSLPPPLALPPAWSRRLLVGALELSSGVYSLTDGSLTGRLSMAAFMLGWAGVSVHLQVLAFLGDSGLSMRTYLTGKLLHGGLSALLMGALAPRLAPTLSVSACLIQQTEAIAGQDALRALALSAAAAWGLWLCFLALAVFPGKKAVEKPKRLRYNR